MGIEKMRLNSGHGRCPFFFVALLLVALFFLTCNWWSLTSDNMELLKEMQKLDTQLNQCTKQSNNCDIRKESLESRVQQDEETILRANNNEKTALNELKSARKQREESNNLIAKTNSSLIMCNTELDSIKNLDKSRTATLDSLRMEKETIAAQLEDKKNKILELEARINQLLDLQAKQPPAQKVKHEGTSSQADLKLPSVNNELKISQPNIFNDQNNQDKAEIIEDAANEMLDNAVEKNLN